jgi:cell division transport system permease protein
MMLSWLFASGADRRLLDTGRLRGPTPWVIAIMSFSIVIIAATGLALAHTGSVLTQAIAARYSIQVPGAGDKLDDILTAVRSAPGVSSAQAVPEQDMRKTLERWLGQEAQSEDLPVPALVNFDAGQGSNLAAIQQRVAAIAPGARISAHKATLAPLLRSLSVLQWVAFGLVVLLSGAAAAAVVLAARGALDTHRFTIEVMHGIGATDLQLTHLFQRRIAIDAFIGSVAGAGAAALVLIFFATGATFAGELTGGSLLSAGDVLVLVLLPLALTMLATWVARTAVLAALRQTL